MPAPRPYRTGPRQQERRRGKEEGPAKPVSFRSGNRDGQKKRRPGRYRNPAQKI